MTTYLVIIALAVISGATTLIGVFFATCCRNKNRLIAAGIGFSAGIMILISFFELIPESMQGMSLEKVFFAFLGGALFLFFLNALLPHEHFFPEGNTKDQALLKSAFLIAFGLIIHDVPEGFAMANSYLASERLGLLLALAIALHNIPEEFAMAIPIIATKRKKFLYKVAVFSGLAEPAGAILGILVVHIYPSLISFLLSFTAGIMTFISVHELLPMARKYSKSHIFFFAGFVVSAVIFVLLNICLPE